MKFKKSEQKLAEWQTATGTLMMAANGRGPVMGARIDMLRGVESERGEDLNRDRKETHWGKRKLNRDE